MSDKAITQKSTVSLALAGVIITGIVANVSMVFQLHEAISLVQHDLTYTNQHISEIKTSLSHLTDETRTDIRETRSSVSTLNDKLAAALNRISELEHQR